MEVYILDSLLRRNEVVDKFQSLIWTERFNKWGDFELKLHSTLDNRNRFPAGTRLIHNDSLRVMEVQTVEDATDDDGRAIIKVAGRSLEHILENRLARGTLGDLTATPKWSITGLPAAIARQIFHDICVTGILDPGDIIPGVVEDSLYPVDTIAEPADSITFEMDPITVYSALSQLCEMYDMGFRLVRDSATLQLYFDVYMGSDRTTKQNTLPAVVFSSGMDNLQNTTEFTSIADYKNVAYVLSPVGSQVVYGTDVDPETEGFERRVLVVKADDIKDVVPEDAEAKMIRRGQEELAKHRAFSGFDGEISKTSTYKYGLNRSYNLGDLVELRNVHGFATDMQVTEQIFVSDDQGDRAYPTLSVAKFITPGSWSAWDYNQVWEDMGATEYWEDMP